MAKHKKLRVVSEESHDEGGDQQDHVHAHGHDHPHEHDHQAPRQILPNDLHSIQKLQSDYLSLKRNYDRLLQQTGQALLKALEIRDPYTYGHSMRVMEYTMLIGRGAQLSIKDLKRLELCALFHDVGKIGVPDCVLLKPARLSPEEQTIMAAHAGFSAEIIGIIDEFKEATDGVKHHHERFDGKGYPSSLKGKDIPLESRIILVADTFDAMTSNRPYRKALPIQTAYDELQRFSGVQFDPEFVKIFLKEHEKLVKSGLASKIEPIIKKRAA
jgi:HD-GYP domain-containing protein (c-di-GMP phosphodiesterase class II)